MSDSAFTTGAKVSGSAENKGILSGLLSIKNSGAKGGRHRRRRNKRVVLKIIKIRTVAAPPNHWIRK
jgi:hypothetical protein